MEGKANVGCFLLIQKNVYEPSEKQVSVVNQPSIVNVTCPIQIWTCHSGGASTNTEYYDLE